MNDMFTTILMDADDTLFDFPKCEYGALKNTIEYFGLDFNDWIYNSFSEINAALWRKFEVNEITRAELRVRRFVELLKKCFDELNFTDTHMLADKYVEELSKQAILIDGAYEAVKEISASCNIYIVTNGLSAVQRGRFGKSPITKFIKKLYISDEMGVQKPNKEFFDLVLADLPEKDSSKILVVGDSLTSDMQGGKNAGLTTCLYDPKNQILMPHPLCDFKISSLSEILN